MLVTGLAFGVVAWHTKGLELSTALHSINNLVTFLIFEFGFATPTTQVSFSELIVNFAVILIPIGLIFLIDRRSNWVGLKRDVN